MAHLLHVALGVEEAVGVLRLEQGWVVIDRLLVSRLGSRAGYLLGTLVFFLLHVQAVNYMR